MLSFLFQPRDPVGERSNDNHIGRREFISALGGTALAWLHTTPAQQPAKLPTIGFFCIVAVEDRLAAFDLGAVLVGCRRWLVRTPSEFAPISGHLRNGGSYEPDGNETAKWAEEMISEEQARADATHLRWLSSVVEYYEHTRFDYRAVWHNMENCAFHFGYYSERVKQHAHALTNSNKVLADIAGVRPGDRVLDAGCGLGGSSFWLASHCAAEVVGISPVAYQIVRAREIAHARSLDGLVRFEQADYTRTSFPDGSFDVVWALESLCHAVHKEAFYIEAARLLRPGGRLVVAEYIRASRKLDEEAEGLISEWLDGWCMPDLSTREEHLASAVGVGLSDVRLIDYTTSTRRSLRRLYKLACVAWPVDRLLFGLGLRSKAQHGNVIASLRQYQLLGRGLWFYGILSATKR
jgi:cyclopropane fatty-acyl-phospholipid synthase-like methyltransferase